MIYIKKALPLDNYRLDISFNTGESGIADMSELITEGVFKKIENPDEFQNFTVDTTIIWDNGKLDIAPEYLYFKAFEDRCL